MGSNYLFVLVRWLAVVLVLRVLVLILVNYPDYFPPDFNSVFLQGREATFHGIYPIAFYIHIFSAPFVLLNGLLLMSDRLRRWSLRWHRLLGRWQVLVLLLLAMPSSLVMSFYAFAGWPAGISFMLLSLITSYCAIVGVYFARRRKIALHRRWMSRCYLLLCSAVFLRLISGATNLLELPDPETAYIIAAWSSWLVPLAIYEGIQRKFFSTKPSTLPSQ